MSEHPAFHRHAPRCSDAATGRYLLFESRLQNCRTPAPLEFHSRFLISKGMCSFKRADPSLELEHAWHPATDPGNHLRVCALGPSGTSSLRRVRYLCEKSLGGNLVVYSEQLQNGRVVNTLIDKGRFNKLTITLQ